MDHHISNRNIFRSDFHYESLSLVAHESTAATIIALSSTCKKMRHIITSKVWAHCTAKLRSIGRAKFLVRRPMFTSIEICNFDARTAGTITHTGIFKNVVELKIDSCHRIKKFHPVKFSMLPNLKKLHCTNLDFDMDSFKVVNLIELRCLSCNIYKNTINELTNLEILEIHNNWSLFYWDLLNLPKLHTLITENIRSAELLTMSNLKHLTLIIISTYEINKLIPYMSNLQTLTLSDHHRCYNYNISADIRYLPESYTYVMPKITDLVVYSEVKCLGELKKSYPINGIHNNKVNRHKFSKKQPHVMNFPQGKFKKSYR